MASAPIERISLVGFGEVGGIFGRDFAKQGIRVSVYDILFHSRESRAAMFAKALDCGVKAHESLDACLRDAELVISAVTASASLDVARDASSILRPGQIFMDINSVSPGTKRADAVQIERSGAHFVESAVMAPVPPYRLRAPMLLGGPYASALAPRLAALGMDAKPVSETIGVASAVKMCRSVMIKGIEALAVECLFAARRYGAEEAVLQSLEATYPQMGWREKLPNYLVSRVAEHGRRRAEEMREVAKSLRDVGVDPMMAESTAERQDWLVLEMAERNLKYKDLTPFSWITLAETLSKAAAGKKTSRKTARLSARPKSQPKRRRQNPSR
jgi:3-hydroxyisobutyrate dehydrogenase-like beta-hydroxyacid dehydrogenase